MRGGPRSNLWLRYHAPRTCVKYGLRVSNICQTEINFSMPPHRETLHLRHGNSRRTDDYLHVIGYCTQSGLQIPHPCPGRGIIIDPSYKGTLAPYLCPCHLDQPHRILCSRVLQLSGVAEMRLYSNVFSRINDFGE